MIYLLNRKTRCVHCGNRGGRFDGFVRVTGAKGSGRLHKACVDPWRRWCLLGLQAANAARQLNEMKP